MVYRSSNPFGTAHWYSLHPQNPSTDSVRGSSQRSYGSYNGASLDSLAAKPVQRETLDTLLSPVLLKIDTSLFSAGINARDLRGGGWV